MTSLSLSMSKLVRRCHSRAEVQCRPIVVHTQKYKSRTMLVTQLAMAAILVTLAKGQGFDDRQKVDLACPDGWIVWDLFDVLSTDAKCVASSSCVVSSSCIVCRWNSALTNPFNKVEICFSRQERSNFGKTELFKIERCSGKLRHELDQRPHCGVRLNVADQRIAENSTDLRPCDKYSSVEGDQRQSVHLACPKNARIASFTTKTFSSHKGVATKAFCVLCKDQSDEKMATMMCTSNISYPRDRFCFHLSETQLTGCVNDGTDKCMTHLENGDFCGFRVTSPTHPASDIFNSSSYIPCSTSMQVILHYWTNNEVKEPLELTSKYLIIFILPPTYGFRLDRNLTLAIMTLCLRLLTSRGKLG